MVERKKALLLLNMGGVNSIDEIELFLKNMFADKNILTMNRYLRSLISYIIITKRLEDVKENYKMIGGKSPLLDITYRLIEKLKKRVDMPIYPVMRYVPPFATESLEKCRDEKIEELILFPMYPQYSTTTTLSSVEDVELRCKELDYHPVIKVVEPYYDRYKYIEACVEKIAEAIDGKDSREYDLILSAHGLPMSIIRDGDPYEKQIEANVSAIKIYLHERGMEFRRVVLAYQSKVGSSAWLEPNLVDILRNPLNKRVLIYPLAFTVDNSETIFELDIEHREIAQKIGYDDYIVAKCFNDDEKFADLIIELIDEV
ncbi:Ferrochelatase, protoheme ferro-lyase [hydrothermal vent metagenome]|uniref:Ferrochelatase, protoheme ferro-lyase n=1 Tax=hydrothermal vent metagenome TaxID=652676 RepID=A0A1W1BCN1_9ZZZZ